MDVIKRWVFSPLETVPSPKVDEARQLAETPEQAEAAAARAHADFPPYELPVCRVYARQYWAPWHEGDHAMVYCLMEPDQLAAAKQDQRLHVFETLHDDSPIPNAVADHHAHRGVKRGHSLRQMLKLLEVLHLNFTVE